MKEYQSTTETRSAAAGVVQKKRNNNGLPDQLKSGIESLSGIDMSSVQVERNSAEPAKVGALAYAQGNQIHLGPGQEKHLPHEAWHVVQQAQGRVHPTTSVNGKPVNDNPGLEKEADVMGTKALQMVSNRTVNESSSTEQHTKACSCAQCMGLSAKHQQTKDAVIQRMEVIQMLKECMYCGEQFSPDIHGEKCPKAPHDGKHHFVKKQEKREKKPPPTAEEIEARRRAKEAKMAMVKSSVAKENEEEEIQAPVPVLLPGEVPYIKEKTQYLVECFKLLHKLRLAIDEGKGVNDRSFRKQAGVFCIKFKHFCESLLQSMLAANPDAIPPGVNPKEDIPYMKRQMKFIDAFIKTLAGLPGIVDFQSCDSAWIDLEVQFKRAEEKLQLLDKE